MTARPMGDSPLPANTASGPAAGFAAGAKRRFPFHVAGRIARELLDMLRAQCERIEVAGSLRRLKADVGDIELVYISAIGQVRGESLFPTTGEKAEAAIRDLLERRVLAKRLNKDGRAAFWPRNKLCVHVASGIPVDLFAATQENWSNYLVCRTGGAENNKRIAVAAQAKGWKWNPYGPGFTDAERQVVPVKSEQDVFETVGLAYLPPWERA